MWSKSNEITALCKININLGSDLLYKSMKLHDDELLGKTEKFISSLSKINKTPTLSISNKLNDYSKAKVCLVLIELKNWKLCKQFLSSIDDCLKHEDLIRLIAAFGCTKPEDTVRINICQKLTENCDLIKV